jgi:hypothetical protein
MLRDIISLIILKLNIMKRITLLLVFIGMITLQSCTVNDVQPVPVDNDTISEVFEINRSFTSSNGYSETFFFPRAIYTSDMVLVYRLSGVSQGNDVWKLQPENYYFPDGTLDYGYNFDFTINDVDLFMVGNNLSTVPSQFRLSQIFRVVVVPGFFGKNAINGKLTNNTVDFKDYNAVIKAFNINESNIKNLN